MQHMILVPQFTVFWNVQYKVKVPSNFLQLSLFLPGFNQWSQTFDTEMIELQDIQKMVFPCIIVFYLWNCENEKYVYIIYW